MIDTLFVNGDHQGTHWIKEIKNYINPGNIEWYKSDMIDNSRLQICMEQGSCTSSQYPYN